MDPYEQKSLEQIVNRAAAMLNVEIKPEGTAEIARRARGTPRIALRLLRRVRDYAQVRADGIINGRVAGEALNMMEIDHLGLDETDIRILRCIIEKFNGGPVGLETIAAAINEDSSTVEDVYEPYLLQLAFIKRTPRGRVAMPAAYEHLGLMPPQTFEQPRLI
jgi:Holliday junction DNA helicase RuvB